MKSRLLLALSGVCVLTSTAEAARLRMQWRGLAPDDRTISLAPGEFAIIDIYMQLSAPSPVDETLAQLSWSNEIAPDLIQVATAPTLPGWSDGSVHGSLGGASQGVSFQADNGFGLIGPVPDTLIGTQTIGLLSVGEGVAMEITFDLESLAVNQIDGSPLPLIANGDFVLVTGWYTIGAGSPGFTDAFGQNQRDPLVVNPVPEPSGLGLLTFGLLTLRARVGRYRIR